MKIKKKKRYIWKHEENEYISYSQAKFSPYQIGNPDIFDQMSLLEENMHIPFEQQCQLAIESHRKAKKWNHPDIVSFDLNKTCLDFDTFTRVLSLRTCEKANLDA